MFEGLEDAVRPMIKVGSDWPKVNEIADKILWWKTMRLNLVLKFLD